MPAPRDVETLVKAARMYFQDGASQQEVADALGTSRSNVSRMLAAAREQRIVEIRINDPEGRDADLEDRLRRQFGLSEVRVAGYLPGAAPMQRVGELAAKWLLESLADVRTVALSWGTTLQAMVWATTTSVPHNIEVVQLVGGLSSVNSQITGQELVRELAARLGANYRYLHAPALLESAQAVQALQAERSIREVLDRARSADVALVGIGAYGFGSSAALMDVLQLTPEQRAEFEGKRPVGDLCARFFDQAGREIHGIVHDRILAVTLSQLRGIPTVVGIVAGREKVGGLRGALNGGFLDVLVCDAALASAVLGQTAQAP